MYRFRIVFRKIIVCCVILALEVSVISCGNTKSSKPNADQYQSGNGMASGNTQQADSVQENSYGALLLSYGVEVPVSRPSIYVDMTGYAAGRDKMVVFAGDSHGEVFHVIRSSDGKVVYTGIIPEESYDELSGQNFSVGNFTEFDEPGTYYIYTDMAGQSYPFMIAQDIYENMFLNILKNVSDANLQESAYGVCDASFGMHVIMHSLMSNGALFEEAYGHLNEDEQDKQLVTQLLYVAKWLISQQQENGSLYDDYEATASFCGIMAMSRDMFGRYEENVDKEYKQAADKAWNWIKSQPCNGEMEKSARFYAAAQLFHASGSESYKTIAEEFLTQKKENYSSDRFVFYGVLSYISAEKDTDRDLCTYIMKDLMEKTEAVCEAAKNDTIFGVSSRTFGGNLSNVLHLSFVNYLTPNKEYTVIIENTIKYMGGLNDTGTCYLGSDGMWTNTEVSQVRNLEWNGIMLLSMGDMLKNLSGYSPDSEIIK